MNSAQISWFETHMHQKVLQLELFPKGLTNQNFKVITAQGSYILRWPRLDQERIVFRAHEAQALKLIQKAQLDVETMAFDVNTGIKVTRYIPELMTFTDYHGPDKMERTASLMRKLHALNTRIGVSFDPIARYRQYASHVSHPMVDPKKAEAIVDRIAQLNRPQTLCHNDWVAGNICFSPTQDYLIDYEYAGDNDPFFDVMSFITENKLTDDEKLRFMLAYFGRDWTDDEKMILYAYGDFHNLLWCTWACMMHESRQETVYLEIAKSKYDALEKGGQV